MASPVGYEFANWTVLFITGETEQKWPTEHCLIRGLREFKLNIQNNVHVQKKNLKGRFLGTPE